MKKADYLTHITEPEKPESQILLSFCIFYGHALHALIFYTPYSDLPAYDTTR